MFILGGYIEATQEYERTREHESNVDAPWHSCSALCSSFLYSGALSCHYRHYLLVAFLALESGQPPLTLIFYEWFSRNQTST